MRMDPFNFLQNRMNQLWREFDRDFSPMFQRISGSNVNEPFVPMITSDESKSGALANVHQAAPLASSWLPAIRLDVKETPQEVIVAADLPGVPKENIKASVDEEGLLHIRAERREEKTENEPSGEWTWRERHHGVVQRTIQLPKSIDPGQAGNAEFKDGVLQMKFHKRPERQGQAIEIK